MTRDELYRRFGPMLLEAVARVILDEINILRTQASLPERDLSQVVDAIENKLNLLTKYDWMNDGN
jgi:hypothetical protein